MPELTVAASPLGDLRQLYRRICLLRAGHRLPEAKELEELTLPAALAAVRSAGDDGQISGLLDAEAAKVADVQAIAELLAPLLAAQLNLARASFPVVAPAAVRPLPSPIRSGAPSIADFIDGMIAQERPIPRPSLSASTPSRPQPAIPRSP